MSPVTSYVSMKICFYEVKLPDTETRDFLEILNEIVTLKDEDRTKSINHIPYRLQELNSYKKTNLSTGDIAKIRMNQVPKRLKLSGKAREVELDDDEGIGEENAFAYYPTLKVLIYQQNRMAVGIQAFAQYLSSVANLSGPIEFDPVLTKDAYQRLAKMGLITKINVQIAGLNNDTLVPEGTSVQKVLKIKEDLKAPYFTITASMGQQKGALSFDKAIQFVKGLKKTGDLKSAKVFGTNDEGHRDELDLIEERMVVNKRIRLNDKREADFFDREQALLEAFEEEKESLNSILSEPK